MSETSPITRKDFLVKCGSACVALAGVSLLGQSCSTLSYVPFTLDKSIISIKKADFATRDFAVLKVEGLQAPIYVAKAASGYSAVLMLCTHKQCELSPYGKVLHCPCHGSEFDNQGTVLQGPAEEALTQFSVTEDENTIYIK